MEKTMIDQISMRIMECDQPVDVFFVYQAESDEAELHGISLDMEKKKDDVSAMVAMGDSLDRFLEEEGVLVVIDGASPRRRVYAVDFNPNEDEIYFFDEDETESLFDLIAPQIGSLTPGIRKSDLRFIGAFPGCNDESVFSYGSDSDPAPPPPFMSD